MTSANTKAPHRNDIEALLPWHAAGTLSCLDAERVEQALAADHELKRQHEMVREELGETIRLNETLGAPSAQAVERLMAAVEADGASARMTRMSFNIRAWLSTGLSQLSPRALVWSVTGAALAVVLQAGLIAGLYFEPADKRGTAFETASYEQPNRPETRGFGQGSYVLVRFTPEATANDITNFLEANKAVVVEGPSVKGLFRLRVGETSPSKDDLAHIVARMQADKNIITFVAVTK